MSQDPHMPHSVSDQDNDKSERAPDRPSIKRWLAIVTGLSVLLFVLALVVGFGTDVGMSIHGYIAMALGIFFSMAVGVGLMLLLFYSARHGYDEEAPTWVLDGQSDDDD